MTLDAVRPHPGQEGTVLIKGVKGSLLSSHAGQSGGQSVKPAFIASPRIQNTFEVFEGPSVEKVRDLKAKGSI